MEFKIIPSLRNNFPIKGLLIKGERLSSWLHNMQALKLSLDDIHVYPIPDLLPNSIWGCFILFRKINTTINPGPHEWVQQVSKNIIPR